MVDKKIILILLLIFINIGLFGQNYVVASIHLEYENVSPSYASSIFHEISNITKAFLSDESTERIFFYGIGPYDISDNGKNILLALVGNINRINDRIELKVKITNYITHEEYLNILITEPFFHPEELNNKYEQLFVRHFSKKIIGIGEKSNCQPGFYYKNCSVHLGGVRYDDGILLNYPDLNFDLNQTKGLSENFWIEYNKVELFRKIEGSIFWTSSIVFLSSLSTGLIIGMNKPELLEDYGNALGLTIGISGLIVLITGIDIMLRPPNKRISILNDELIR